MSDILTIVIASVAGIGYIFRLEAKNQLQDQAIKALEKLIGVYLANIDTRLARIEKKVLNGHD